MSKKEAKNKITVLRFCPVEYGALMARAFMVKNPITGERLQERGQINIVLREAVQTVFDAYRAHGYPVPDKDLYDRYKITHSKGRTRLRGHALMKQYNWRMTPTDRNALIWAVTSAFDVVTGQSIEHPSCNVQDLVKSRLEPVFEWYEAQGRPMIALNATEL